MRGGDSWKKNWKKKGTAVAEQREFSNCVRATYIRGLEPESRQKLHDTYTVFIRVLYLYNTTPDVKINKNFLKERKTSLTCLTPKRRGQIKSRQPIPSQRLHGPRFINRRVVTPPFFSITIYHSDPILFYIHTTNPLASVPPQNEKRTVYGVLQPRHHSFSLHTQIARYTCTSIGCHHHVQCHDIILLPAHCATIDGGCSPSGIPGST